MDCLKSPIPQICIVPAPQEDAPVEPSSPFAWSLMTPTDDGFRPIHLTPPPTGSPRFAKQLSPLRPAESLVTGKGLERERFEALLKASRDRNVAVGAKKPVDLRKEIALKAHKSKQVERRALFLSKVRAPPSPTAMSTPKTPPESPAIFHYTLPSPGLDSPLSLFESVYDDPSLHSIRVEQVQFRMPADQQPKRSPAPKARPNNETKSLPSLDEIVARLNNQKPLPRVDIERAATPKRLPAFLQSNARINKQLPTLPTEVAPTPPPKPTQSTTVGRLQMPIRSQPIITAPQPVKARSALNIVPPRSPSAPLTPRLEVTTIIIPRVSTTSPSKLSESNLQALNSRARMAQDMLSTLRRRTVTTVGSRPQYSDSQDERRGRRISAPAEMQTHARSGFEHAVLGMPGGF